MEEGKNTVPMLHKALDVLEYIGNSPSPVTLPELQRSLGIAQSSCFRIVATLVARRWLDRCAGGTYEIAGGILPVANKAHFRLEPYRKLQPVLNHLADKVVFSVKFSVRDGDEFVNVCAAKTRRDALIFSDPGFRSPLSVPVSVSAIMLSEGDAAGWKRLTAGREEEFARLRDFFTARGFCFIAGSPERDAPHAFDTLSVPVRRADGALAGVISLLGLPGAIAPHMDRIAGMVAGHAGIIAGLL